MGFFDLIQRKKRLLEDLLTEEASKNFVRAFYRSSEESPFKVGETIHPERFGIPLGPFEVTGLKIGGQAVIYTVLADHSSSIYALKTFQNWCYRERGMFERFMREAEIMMDLGRHPSLLRARAVFLMNGRPYILVEYVAGSNLRQKLRSEGLAIEEALRYAIELSRGLAHAQAALPTFIHRDLKPDNCLVTNDGGLKICDFGQAKTTAQSVVAGNAASHDQVRSSPFGSKTTLANHLGAGTPDYMAPEQFHTDSVQDLRTDVYSFGVVLFELLTGDVPFTAEGHEEFFETHSHAAPPDPRSINPTIPDGLGDLVLCCLAKAREDRPADFVEIERELQQIRFRLLGSRLPTSRAEVETAEDTFKRGFSLLQFQRYDEAISCFELLGDDVRFKADAAIFTSVALAARGDLGDAEGTIDRVLAAAPKNSGALNQKGVLLKRRGRFHDAIGFFDRAIAFDSKFVEAMNNKGACLIELGQLDKAISAARRSLAVAPLQNAAFRNLGEIYQQMNQREQSLESYLKAVEADPRDVDSLVELSNELARAGRYAEALDYLEQAIWLTEGSVDRERICEEMTELLTSGGKTVLDLDRKDDSTIYQWFIAATRLNCLNPSSLREATGEIIAGLPHWRSWQKAALGKCLVELSERSEPGYQLREVRYSIGRMFYELGRYDFAGPVFTSLVESHAEDAQSLFYLAACDEREGKDASALELYQQALRYDPDSIETRAAIVRLGGSLSSSAKSASAAIG